MKNVRARWTCGMTFAAVLVTPTASAAMAQDTIGVASPGSNYNRP